MASTLNKRATRGRCNRIADCFRGDTVKTPYGVLYLLRRIRGGWIALTVDPATLTADGRPGFWVSPVLPVQEMVETVERREWRAGMEWIER